jgi:hypothetical protein
MPVYLAPTAFTPALQLSTTHAANGDVVKLRVTAAPGTPSGAIGLAVVGSQSGQLSTMWPVLIEVE